MIATAELEAGLGGRVLGRRPYRYATSAHLEVVEVRLIDGSEKELLLKATARSVSLRRPGAKPAFVYDPAREVAVYRSLLPASGLPTAGCHAAFADRDRSWLLLEKVEGVELWQVGDLARWAAVAAWLPDMHRALSTAPVAPQRLLQHGPGLWRRFLERARRSVIDERTRRLVQCHPAVVDELAALPVGVVHGEFYPSNVLVAGERNCPVDWEMTGTGPPLLDIAALVSGWPPAEADHLLRAYATAAAGTADAPSLARHVRLCRLQQCVQWLGWSDSWTPPPEHARDWLDEAMALTDELDL